MSVFSKVLMRTRIIAVLGLLALPGWRAHAQQAEP
jgi:hypothetical protein